MVCHVLLYSTISWLDNIYVHPREHFQVVVTTISSQALVYKTDPYNIDLYYNNHWILYIRQILG
jgi:hypothetical protein